MESIDDYMKLPYRMEIVPDLDEDGYDVEFPELPGCITSAETIEEAVEYAQDAKREWLRAALEDHVLIPLPRDLEQYSGQFL